MPTKLIVKLRKGTTDFETRGIRGNNKVPLQDETTLGIIDSQSNKQNEWDQAHDTLKSDREVVFAEPDVDSSEPFYPAQSINALQVEANQAQIDYGKYIKYWKHPTEPDVWHIRQNFSQLEQARQHVINLNGKNKIRIAHLDTGYDEEHQSYPEHLVDKTCQRSFIDGENENNAEDRFLTGILTNPGHGTGTMSILAGEKMPVAGCPSFNDYVGLKEFIEIVPIRIAKSVVLFKSAAFVKAMNYILNELHENEETRVQVITMSMGGLASRAWADVVNEAYEKGIFMVTAAGNNFLKLPTRRLIFPARFNRVVAACGVTYDFSPYAKPEGEGAFNIMEGNHGPRALMDTAMAAFTPNVPWAIYKYKDVFGIRGDGTSSATPQIAAAAALYYSKHYDDLQKLPEGWMRVEAIRHALFSSAKKNVITGVNESYEYYYGNGILQANDALAVPVPSVNFFTKKVKQKKDNVFLPLIRILLGLRKELTEEEEQTEEMMETELMQLAMADPEIQNLIDNDENDDITNLNLDQRNNLAMLVLKNPKASNALKQKIQSSFGPLEG